jgi:hypothetical protein
MLAFTFAFPWLVLPAAVFYGILFILVLVAAAFAANDSGSTNEGDGLWTFVFGPFAIFLLIRAFTNIPFPHFSVAQWIGIVAGYLLIGAVWTIYKWFSLVRRFLAKSLDTVERLALSKDIESIKDDRDSLHKWASNYSASTIPLAKTNRPLLSFWIFYWPFSVIGTLTGDFTRVVLDMLSGVYDSISNRAQRKLTARIEELDAQRRQAVQRRIDETSV